MYCDNWNGIKAPCKDCEDRKLRCHSTCERYLDFKAKNEKRLEEKHKQSIMDSYALNKSARFREMRRRASVPDSSISKILRMNARTKHGL